MATEVANIQIVAGDVPEVLSASNATMSVVSDGIVDVTVTTGVYVWATISLYQTTDVQESGPFYIRAEKLTDTTCRVRAGNSVGSTFNTDMNVTMRLYAG